METVKGTPYFCQTKNKLKQYPYLDRDLECEILIIGGGIDGAIAGYFLSKKHDVVLVDKNKIGFGCTSCATALLEYQLDEMASDLMAYLTESEIVSIYEMGLKSKEELKKLAHEFGNDCQFALRPTFLYTDSDLDSQNVIDEFNFRKKNGFNCQLITKTNNPFPFKVSAGIYCEDGGCEFNPYIFTKLLVEHFKNQKNIFEHTTIEKIFSNLNGDLIAKTNYGYEIKCKKIILATGFNWQAIDKDNLCDRFVSNVTSKPNCFSFSAKSVASLTGFCNGAVA